MIIKLKKKKKHKYNAKSIVIDGHKFPSLKEGRQYRELKLRELTGSITDLELQPVFVLQDKFKRHDKTIRAIKYQADFRYKNKEGHTIVVDVKGKKTAMYELKIKMLFKRYPDINFIET